MKLSYTLSDNILYIDKHHYIYVRDCWEVKYRMSYRCSVWLTGWFIVAQPLMLCSAHVLFSSNWCTIRWLKLKGKGLRASLDGYGEEKLFCAHWDLNCRPSSPSESLYSLYWLRYTGPCVRWYTFNLGDWRFSWHLLWILLFGMWFYVVLVETYWCLRGTCCLHLQGRRISILFYPKDRGNKFLS